MGVRPDFTMPIAAICVGLAVAMPRLHKGLAETSDWLYAGIGLGVALIAAIALIRSTLKR
jgi:hypothetical protein